MLDTPFRVPHTLAHSPLPLQSDWPVVADCLAGAEVNLTVDDSKYRRAEDEKIQHVRDAAHAAFTAFQASVTDQTVPAFPALNPTQADAKTVQG